MDIAGLTGSIYTIHYGKTQMTQGNPGKSTRDSITQRETHVAVEHSRANRVLGKTTRPCSLLVPPLSPGKIRSPGPQMQSNKAYNQSPQISIICPQELEVSGSGLRGFLILEYGVRGLSPSPTLLPSSVFSFFSLLSVSLWPQTQTLYD